MEQNLKQVLLATLNPDTGVRNEAERQLEVIGKTAEMMYVIQTVLMKDGNNSTRHIASIYFANALKKNWEEPGLAGLVREVQERIISYLTIEDRYELACYESILQHMFDRCEMSVLEGVCRGLGYFMGSASRVEYMGALRFVEGVFKSEKLRYNLESVLEIVFGTNGAAFIGIFQRGLASKDYEVAKKSMKITMRVYAHYSLPDFLCEASVFDTFFKLALGIVKMEGSEDPLVGKLRKWASCFLYKSTSKAFKKYFKAAALIDYVRAAENCDAVAAAFFGLVERHAAGERFHERTLIYTCDFFTVLAQTKATKAMVRACYGTLLNKLVLPAQVLDAESEEVFECSEERYLRERYNYVTSGLRARTAALFSDILHIDKQVRTEAVSLLLQALKNTAIPDYNRVRYGIIGLLAGEQKSLAKVLPPPGLAAFVAEYVAPDLHGDCAFLTSQALLFLHLCEHTDFDEAVMRALLEQTLKLIESQNENIAVEALLALSFFIGANAVYKVLDGLVPVLIEKLIRVSKRHALESFNSLMDTITETHTSAVAEFAPQFAASICANILEHLQRNDEARLATVSGFITNIDKLIINAGDQVDIVRGVFNAAKKVIYTIFANRIADFYQEALDLMNSFLFIIEEVNEDMLVIFGQALAIEREDLSYYPREISDFIENFLSFGKDKIINYDVLKKIYETIDVFIPAADEPEEIYDEDFEAGCRIADSLMLNAGARAHAINQHIIPCIVHKIVFNYDMATQTSYEDAVALETIMNCFLIAPQEVLTAMDKFTPVFFDEIVAKRFKFTRVHDKKVFLLFIGALFKISAAYPLDIEKITEAFVDVFCSLPDAIKKRNRLKEREDEEDIDEDIEDADDADDNEYDDDYCDDEFDTLVEDIWFESDLDKFDAYSYVKQLLAAPIPKSIGEVAITKMSQAQILKVNEILSVPQEAQK